MVTNLKRLSAALDKAAPPATTAASVVAAIRSNRESIDNQIRRTGVAYVTVDGLRVKVSPSHGGGAVATRE
jgi:hypothetical protein